MRVQESRAKSRITRSTLIWEIPAYGLVSILGALGCAVLLGKFGAIEVEDGPNASSH